MTLKRFFLLGFTLLATWILNLSSGKASIPLQHIPSVILTGPNLEDENATIIWEIRLPKSLAAALAGAALAVAGLQLQTLFRNPLAGPYELGISAGAAFGMALFTMAGWEFPTMGLQLGSLGAAILGALSVMGLLATIAPWLRNASSLLLAGLLISSGLSAGIGALQFRSDAEALQTFVDWTLGSVGGVTWMQLSFFVPICFMGLLCAFLGAKPLNALLLGELEAKSLGSRVVLNRFIIASGASLLAATVAAFCGPIAFVGLGMPHVARWMCQTSDHRVLIPFAACIGASAVLLCDTLAQLVIPGNVLPLNVVASALGAPLVLIYLLKRRIPEGV